MLAELQLPDGHTPPPRSDLATVASTGPRSVDETTPSQSSEKAYTNGMGQRRRAMWLATAWLTASLTERTRPSL